MEAIPIARLYQRNLQLARILQLPVKFLFGEKHPLVFILHVELDNNISSGIVGLASAESQPLEGWCQISFMLTSLGEGGIFPRTQGLVFVIDSNVNVIMVDMKITVRVSNCNLKGKVGLGEQRIRYSTVDVRRVLVEAKNEDEDKEKDREETPTEEFTYKAEVSTVFSKFALKVVGHG